VKVMVTGTGGMLGRDVVRLAEQAGHEVVQFTHDELDITDATLVGDAILGERPEALVNCGAWTNVDGAESDLEGATAVNGTGAAHIALATDRIGCKVVYPSSDYVFDGTKGEAYVESDETNPLSAYGKSKLAGERETALVNPRHFIVRASWLFGVNGKNFVDTMMSLGRELDEVVVVADQIGCPTYTGHLAEGIVRLIEWDDYGRYHMAGAGECSWFEFAVEIFAQAGIDCRVMSTTTEELGRPAPRPAYSVLVSEREPTIYLPDWREGLAAFLAERAQTEAAPR
jgi:dTDP-4-dehydrorhamnose reductase